MNRRQFLTRALAAVPVIAAPAVLLDVLNASRTYFLPPQEGWPNVNTVYLLNSKYVDRDIVELLIRRMNEAAESMQHGLSRVLYEPCNTIERITGERPDVALGITIDGKEIYFDPPRAEAA